MAMMNASAVSAAMDEYTRLRPDKAQFARSFETIRFFKARDMMMKGEKYHYKVFTQPMRAVRRVGNAVAAETEEYPEAKQLGHVDVEVAWSDLYEFRASVEYSTLAESKTKDLKHAIYRTAVKLVEQTEDNFGEMINAAMHQNADCVMAKVSAVYDEDGTDYTAGQTDAFLAITGGAVSQFQVGDRLDIRNGADGTDIRCCVVVNDVIPDSSGPQGNAVGPGIVVTIDSTQNAVERFGASQDSTGDSNLDNVAADDEIVLEREADSSNFQSLPVWFSYDTDVFNITRTAKGSAWSIPMITDKSSGGSPVDLDLEAHLGLMAMEWSRAIKFGRRARKREGLTVSQEAMVALGPNELIAEASTQVGDAISYTVDMTDQNMRKKLFGFSGFDGAYWRNPLIGPISFVADPVATPNCLRFMEPSSWTFIIGHDGNHQTISWLDQADGGRFHYERGSNGRLKGVIVAGAYMRLALANDQPRANMELRGVKSSVGNY